MLAALTQFLCSIFAARIQLIDNFIFSVSGLIQKTLMDFFLFSKNFSGQEKKTFFARKLNFCFFRVLDAVAADAAFCNQD